VTPILSHARELARRGKSFEVHYAAHTPQTSRGFPQRRLEQKRRGEAGREHPFLILDRKVKNEYIIDMARPREFDVEKALDQAMRTFWEHGYQGTSMSDLMKASHVQKQSLYCAFGDKHSLFVKCLELYRNQVVSQVKAIVEKTASPFAAVEKVMRYAIEPAAAKKAPQGCLAANTALELGFKDPEAAMQVKRMLQGLERILEGVIKKGQINGEISTRFDSELIAKSLVNTLNGIRVLERTGASARQMRMIVDMALDAIKS
jgi:TetR/AcrR family transcriptional regulator, transcriptional repressor for nem operon